MKNVGSTDKVIRLVIFAVLVVSGFLTAGTLRYILWAVSLVPLITALVNFCPVWAALKINTAHK